MFFCMTMGTQGALRGRTSEWTGTLRHCAARRMLPRTARGAMPQRVRVERPVSLLSQAAWAERVDVNTALVDSRWPARDARVAAKSEAGRAA